MSSLVIIFYYFFTFKKRYAWLTFANWTCSVKYAITFWKIRLICRVSAQFATPTWKWQKMDSSRVRSVETSLWWIILSARWTSWPKRPWMLKFTWSPKKNCSKESFIGCCSHFSDLLNQEQNKYELKIWATNTLPKSRTKSTFSESN